MLVKALLSEADPPEEMLFFHAGSLETVEINTSFCRLQEVDPLEAMVEES